MERRLVPTGDEQRVALEERTDGPPSLQGYCAVYYRADQPGTQYELWPGVFERILPGAFHESLRDGDDVRCFFNHDHNLVLGRSKSGTLTLADFDKGLRYTCRLPDTSTGRDVAAMVRRGDVTGSSFAFTVRDGGEAWVQEGDKEVRLLTRLRLHDTSPCAVPAYESSSVALRAAGDLAEVRAAHETWKAGQQRAADLQARLDGYRRRAERVGAK
jgi:HK97 family phage prohead protease